MIIDEIIIIWMIYDFIFKFLIYFILITFSVFYDFVILFMITFIYDFN